MSGDVLGSAHRVLTAHEEAMKAADLDGVVANAADDIVVLLPGSPLIEGRVAFQESTGSCWPQDPQSFSTTTRVKTCSAMLPYSTASPEEQPPVPTVLRRLWRTTSSWCSNPTRRGR
jgi:hypothetical protein